MNVPTQQTNDGERTSPLDNLLHVLQGRAKELLSIDKVDEILQSDKPFDEQLRLIVETIPNCWQYPLYCQARLSLRDFAFSTPGFCETPWELKAPIVVSGAQAGEIAVVYTQPTPASGGGPFL